MFNVSYPVTRGDALPRGFRVSPSSRSGLSRRPGAMPAPRVGDNAGKMGDVSTGQGANGEMSLQDRRRSRAAKTMPPPALPTASGGAGGVIPPDIKLTASADQPGDRPGRDRGDEGGGKGGFGVDDSGTGDAEAGSDDLGEAPAELAQLHARVVAAIGRRGSLDDPEANASRRRRLASRLAEMDRLAAALGSSEVPDPAEVEALLSNEAVGPGAAGEVGFPDRSEINGELRAAIVAWHAAVESEAGCESAAAFPHAGALWVAGLDRVERVDLTRFLGKMVVDMVMGSENGGDR